MMITQIGFAAGDIWQYLDQHQNRETKLSFLVVGLDRPRDLLLMSVGWLAREGYLIVKQDGYDYQVCLRNETQ